MATLQRLHAVVFDVGETIVDESREYGTWADWLGIPRHTFSAMFGAVLAESLDYRQVFQWFRPGFDLDKERARRAEAGFAETLGESDLYADARPALKALKAQGLVLGLAGNQTARAHELLSGLALPVDFVATSAEWGVEKPAPAFFQGVVHACACEPAQVVYVGDRLDNDIQPAAAAGMVTVQIRRGPWGHLTAGGSSADHVIDSLAELPALLGQPDH